MGARDHKQRRRPHTGQQPLYRRTVISEERVKTVNGIYDSTTIVDPHREREFSQSAYVHGDFVTPNSHSYVKFAMDGLYGRIVSNYYAFGPPLITLSGAMGGYINYPTLRIYDYRDMTIVDRNRRRVRGKFFSRLRDSGLNLAVDLAESPQTKKMMSNTINDVIGIARKARRYALNTARANEALKALPHGPERRRLRDRIPSRDRGETDPSKIMANKWLEWQYGWKPLLGTIFGICDYQRSKARRFRIASSDKERSFNRSSHLDPGSGLRVKWDMENSTYCTIKCDFRAANPYLNDVSRFTSMNPLAIAWELVPYSFVVDWFYNIGGYMEELETALGSGLEFVRGYETYTHRYLNKVLVPPQSQNIGWWAVTSTLSPMHGREYYVEKHRIRLYDTPLPFFPKLEAKLGAQRLLSAAALLRQIFTFKR